jgi:ribosome-associated heat shock protein Hsp15
MAPERAPDDERQRLDKWLWFTRVVKTRTLATRLVETGKARVNRTKVTKASRTVRAGDVITLVIHEQVRVLKVLACGARRGPAAEARELYEDMSPPLAPREKTPRRPPSPAQREKGAGRPTKRDRRKMLAWMLNKNSSEQ